MPDYNGNGLPAYMLTLSVTTPANIIWGTYQQVRLSLTNNGILDFPGNVAYFMSLNSGSVPLIYKDKTQPLGIVDSSAIGRTLFNAPPVPGGGTVYQDINMIFLKPNYTPIDSGAYNLCAYMFTPEYASGSFTWTAPAKYPLDFVYLKIYDANGTVQRSGMLWIGEANFGATLGGGTHSTGHGRTIIFTLPAGYQATIIYEGDYNYKFT